MTLVSKNLGQAAAIIIRSTPPTRTTVLWFDTSVGVNKLKYYNTSTSAWVDLVPNSSSGAIVEKAPVRLATTGAESAVTYDQGLKEITVNTAEGPLEIDGVAASLNDAVLWGGDGSVLSLNGIYK